MHYLSGLKQLILYSSQETSYSVSEIAKNYECLMDIVGITHACAVFCEIANTYNILLYQNMLIS